MEGFFVFKKVYFLWAAVLLAVEFAIGIYMHDRFIRPYGGDFLVVILIYCFIKSFMAVPVKTTAMCVLAFACAVEVSQYFKLVARLGFKNSRAASILLGNSFSWTDMLMYTLGILLVVGVEAVAKGMKKYGRPYEWG